jgi:predicted transcriptional regulator
VGIETAQQCHHSVLFWGLGDPMESCDSIATRMETLAIELRSLSGNHIEEPDPSGSTLLSLAGKLYSARRKVDEIFGMAGFSVSPAWDIMLDLYQARASDAMISVTSASIGAACPPTTALRWLQSLESMQLIERSQDPRDGRRTTIGLTDKGWSLTAEALRSHLKS